MCLSCLAIIGKEIRIQIVQVSLLLAGSSVSIVVLVLDLFPLGVGVVREQLGYGNRWRICLSLWLFLLGLLLLGLLLLGSASINGYCRLIFTVI